MFTTIVTIFYSVFKIMQHTYKADNSFSQNNIGRIRLNFSNYNGHEVVKLVSCSTQLSMELQNYRYMLIRTKMLKSKDFLVLILSDVVFIMLINVKMPIVGN